MKIILLIIALLILTMTGVRNFGGVETFSDNDEIKLAQEAYFAKNGVYFQVLKGNVVPEYQTGTVAKNLGKNLPDNMSIDIYDAPTGKGYEIITDDSSVGFGPESSYKTKTFYKAPIASTTP